MNSIANIIKSSYGLVENRPEPYGAFHLIFVALSLAVIVTACYFMRKNNDKTFRIVLFSIGTALILSEIYKQLYFLYAAGGEGYDWDIFPFQLCSVPMYLSVAVGCMKKCKARDILCEYLVCIGFLGGIMAYAEPSGILKKTYFELVHSCLWHAMLIFIALYILFTNNACSSLKNYPQALIVFAGVVIVATVLNVIFYNKPNFNMCYISPFYNTPLAVFKDFDVFFKNALGIYTGRIVSIIIYVIAIALGGFAVYSASYGIKKLTNNARKKKTS